ncbi:MAG: dTDP-4-amino-4,6-dideoxygalactose transaminase [Planctomycetota bacterium]|jgi:dTDP-4-amino-4,6-dideoxygalactose transaminase
MQRIPFNRPFIVGKELYYIAQAVQRGHLAGDGGFTKKCHAWMEEKYQAKKVFLTHSCTSALEMAAILADIQPGDEVIMPSYTFVSTANAFALRGAKLIFVDIREDTLNINECLIEAAITEKTKAIVPVHYASVGCEMDTITKIAEKHDLLVIEDAAQGVNATYKGRYLGTIGQLGCYSFHETKNYISGEGGALVVNDERFIERAEIIREKGTNRSKFHRGEIDKYTWVDIGSSYLPSELAAAFLCAQLEEADTINNRRRYIWRTYYDSLFQLQEAGLLRLPFIPNECSHNAHMFYLILQTEEIRNGLIDFLKKEGVHSVFHYVPLHQSPMGMRLSARKVRLRITEHVSSRIVRLPCYYELTSEQQHHIISLVKSFVGQVDMH